MSKKQIVLTPSQNTLKGSAKGGMKAKSGKGMK